MVERISWWIQQNTYFRLLSELIDKRNSHLKMLIVLWGGYLFSEYPEKYLLWAGWLSLLSLYKISWFSCTWSFVMWNLLKVRKLWVTGLWGLTVYKHLVSVWTAQCRLPADMCVSRGGEGEGCRQTYRVWPETFAPRRTINEERSAFFFPESLQFRTSEFVLSSLLV